MTTATTARSRSLVLRLAAAGASFVALAASCSAADTPDGATRLDAIEPVAALTPFDSCVDLLTHLQGAALERVGPYGLEGADPYGPVAILEGGGADTSSLDDAVRQAPTAAAEAAGPTVSGTNVQEAGIDEPDLVKASSERMVVVTATQLVVVDLAGDTPEVAGRLDLPNGFDHELLVAGDRALVLTREDSGAYPTDGVIDEGISYRAAVPTTSLTMVDLDNPAGPRVMETLSVESRYVSARMQGAVAQVVVTSGGPDLGFVYPSESSPTGERRAQETNEAAIRETTLNDWLPGWSLEGDRTTASGRLDDCDSVHRPAEFAGFGLVSVLTVDLESDLGEPDPVSVLGAGDTVYASAGSLYVATERLVEEPASQPGSAEQTEEASEPVPGDELIDIAPVQRDIRTSIHRFSTPASGPVEYEASGEVEGRLLNQFSLSEHEGVLRVATTRGEPWLVESSDSLVSTLEQAGDQLVELGRVEDLGRGEQIFAVRFVGPVGYVVTFRQTDPLYVIDLRDPSAPKVEGELKIQGYSAYLHPIDDTHVLGVGQDADESGLTSGTQVSLFDVSDPADPVRTAQITVPGGSSEVEWDHRAFLWWAPTGTVVLPIELNGGRTAHPSSALVLNLDAGAGMLSERGRVSHEFNPVRRAVVVDDTLVTVDSSGLVFSTLTDLAREAEVDL